MKQNTNLLLDQTFEAAILETRRLPNFIRDHSTAHALITMGGTITDARGSIAGNVFSRNKGGAYIRARVAPINRNTPAQTLVRANFGSNAKAWSSLLTAAQRTAWTNFAAANPLINILGASIIVSGISMFMKLNQVLSQIGSANITDPPVDLSVPPLAAPYGGNFVTMSQVAQVLTAAQTSESGASYYVFATKPLAPGKTPQQSDLRFVMTKQQTVTDVMFSLQSFYGALFGDFIVGQTIGLAIATVNVSTGAVTPALQFNITTT